MISKLIFTSDQQFDAIDHPQSDRSGMDMSRADAELEQRAYHLCVSNPRLQIEIRRPGYLMSCNIDMGRTDWWMTPLAYKLTGIGDMIHRYRHMRWLRLTVLCCCVRHRGFSVSPAKIGHHRVLSALNVVKDDEVLPTRACWICPRCEYRPRMLSIETTIHRRHP